MKTRTTNHSATPLPKVPAPVGVSLLEKLFDPAPDVAFFIKDAAALRRLRETDQSVADIAPACGFYDPSAFARTFRAMTGATPTQFRSR